MVTIILICNLKHKFASKPGVSCCITCRIFNENYTIVDGNHKRDTPQQFFFMLVPLYIQFIIYLVFLMLMNHFMCRTSFSHPELELASCPMIEVELFPQMSTVPTCTSIKRFKNGHLAGKGFKWHIEDEMFQFWPVAWSSPYFKTGTVQEWGPTYILFDSISWGSVILSLSKMI